MTPNKCAIAPESLKAQTAYMVERDDEAKQSKIISGGPGAGGERSVLGGRADSCGPEKGLAHLEEPTGLRHDQWICVSDIAFFGTQGTRAHAGGEQADADGRTRRTRRHGGHSNVAGSC